MVGVFKQALKGVSFSVGAGRIVGLVGENGAGKSTLMNLLGGNLQPDAGEIRVNGQPYAPRNPNDARAAGIAFVHQELNLFPNLSIAAQLDARGRYEVTLTPEFPLSIKLFRYTSKRHTRGGTWHERLELFTPLDGTVKFRMGDQTLALDRGDVLVVDNLKVHHVVDFPGFDTRVIVVSFQPEFVYSLGSPAGDYTFLLPFYSKLDQQPHVLRAESEATPSAHAALTELLRAYFAKDERQFVQAGSKAFLLALLHQLARHFRARRTC